MDLDHTQSISRVFNFEEDCRVMPDDGERRMHTHSLETVYLAAVVRPDLVQEDHANGRQGFDSSR